MGVPLRQQLAVGSYLIKQKLKGVKKYPLVLMLEPLFRCNLACAGCGKIDYEDDILDQRLSFEECMQAVDECGAPMVSIPGGEPLIHKEMPQIVAGIVARKKFVYLCTNALLLKKRIDDYTPSPYLTFSIHLELRSYLLGLSLAAFKKLFQMPLTVQFIGYLFWAFPQFLRHWNGRHA